MEWCRVFSAWIPALLALVDMAYGRAVAEETREETRGESLPPFACLQATIDASRMTRVASRQEDGYRHARLHLHAEARPSWRALGRRFVPPGILTSGPQPGRERPRVLSRDLAPGPVRGVAHVLAAGALGCRDPSRQRHGRLPRCRYAGLASARAREGGSEHRCTCGDEQALVLASGILDDVRVDVSRVVGLGLSFTAHVELRMEQCGVTEVDVRMLERQTWYEPSVVDGRFMIHVTHQQRPWIVIVKPDVEAKLLVVVTVYEVSG